MTDSPRRIVGPWTLHEQLGRGGNGTVWRASCSESDTDVALKIINSTRVEREPYRRFVREIEFLREHQDDAGVLPLLDAYLPEEPSRDDPPWLAMPIAIPIADALADATLDDVVASVATIADTLCRLEADFNIAHRDLKPGNLYHLSDTWLIGDFGLVSVPDADPLTQEGRQVGPAHYTAYEMIIDATSADPHPADVYSLGKTLWALATGLAYPPEGHQPIRTRGFEIGDFRPHARAGALDHEVDLMTRLHAEERPSKQQVARDLAAWRELSTEPVVIDVSQERIRLREKLESRIAEQDTREQQKLMAREFVRRLQEQTAPLSQALRDLYPATDIDSVSDKLTRNLLKTYLPSTHLELVWRWQCCTRIIPFDLPGGAALRMSRAVELFGDGSLVLLLMVDVGPEGVAGARSEWRFKYTSAPVGSVEAEKMLDDGVAEMAAELHRGIEVFIQQLPDPPGG
jgi:serine/threonine protein kinase